MGHVRCCVSCHRYRQFGSFHDNKRRISRIYWHRWSQGMYMHSPLLQITRTVGTCTKIVCCQGTVRRMHYFSWSGKNGRVSVVLGHKNYWKCERNGLLVARVCHSRFFFSLFQLQKPLSHKPPIRFGTVPFSHTDSTISKYFKEMHAYMSQYNRSSVKEGVDSVLSR